MVKGEVIMSEFWIFYGGRKKSVKAKEILDIIENKRFLEVYTKKTGCCRRVFKSNTESKICGCGFPRMEILKEDKEEKIAYLQCPVCDARKTVRLNTEEISEKNSNHNSQRCKSTSFFYSEL